MNTNYPGEKPSDYSNSGYHSDGYQSSGYSLPQKSLQGNFEDGYQENLCDESNLADNAWTDTATRPNPQLELEL